jgi:hypothetical protein
MAKMPVYLIVSENLKQTLGPETHPEIRFLKNVTGAFVARGLNPRESIAYFGFYNDGLLEPCALGFDLRHRSLSA